MGGSILLQLCDILPKEELLEEQLAVDDEWLNLLVESALLRSKLHVLTGAGDQFFYLFHIVPMQRSFHIELKSLDLVHGPRIRCLTHRSLASLFLPVVMDKPVIQEWLQT